MEIDITKVGNHSLLRAFIQVCRIKGIDMARGEETNIKLDKEFVIGKNEILRRLEERREENKAGKLKI